MSAEKEKKTKKRMYILINLVKETGGTQNVNVLYWLLTFGKLNKYMAPLQLNMPLENSSKKTSFITSTNHSSQGPQNWRRWDQEKRNS